MTPRDLSHGDSEASPLSVDRFPSRLTTSLPGCLRMLRDDEFNGSVQCTYVQARAPDHVTDVCILPNSHVFVVQYGRLSRVPMATIGLPQLRWPHLCHNNTSTSSGESITSH